MFHYSPIPLILRCIIHVCVYSSDSYKYFIQGNDRIGGTYKKALFIEYTDDTFLTPRNRTEDELHLGSLGPVVRGEVGDTIEVVFRNKVGLASASSIGLASEGLPARGGGGGGGSSMFPCS